MGLVLEILIILNDSFCMRDMKISSKEYELERWVLRLLEGRFRIFMPKVQLHFSFLGC